MKPSPITIDDIPEDVYDDIANKAYELAHVVAAEALSPRYLKRAGECYAADLTDEASWWKRLAKDCEVEAKQLRAAYWAKYPASNPYRL